HTGAPFCYHCKAAWHPTQTCDAARRTRQPPPRAPSANHADLDHGEVKPCPRCSVLIVKVEDGSCLTQKLLDRFHTVLSPCKIILNLFKRSRVCEDRRFNCIIVAGALRCSPSGCTFWGKKPWSRKKKLLWQLGTLAGAPLGIAVVAGVALPALLVGLPLWAGRRAHRRLRRAPPAQRRAAVAAAVAAALVVSPLVAGLAVGIGVPILLFYVYGVVPVSLCRAGGCGPPPHPRPHRFDERDEPDAASRRLEPSIGDASLSAGSHQASEAARASSLAALAGSLGGGQTGSIGGGQGGSLGGGQEAPLRLEVSAEVCDTASAASWPDDAPSTSARAKLRALFLYGAAPPPTPPPDPEAGVAPPPEHPAPSPSPAPAPAPAPATLEIRDDS
ncbi:hypothetical protein evm_014549, partial [Chilo suppressalis]